MDLELKKLRDTFREILRGNPALARAIDRVNRINMIKCPLIARSEYHEKISVADILDGNLDPNVALGDYTFMEKAGDVVSLLQTNMSMGNSVDKNLLLESYRVLAGDSKAYFRKGNPVVYSFNHVPPHRADIDGELTKLFRKVYSGNTDDDPVMRAMILHKGIIEIWPFDEYSAELSLFLMNYFLMERGFMPVTFGMPRKEYLEIIGDNIKGRRQEEFYYTLREAVEESTERAIRACNAYAD